MEISDRLLSFVNIKNRNSISILEIENTAKDTINWFIITYEKEFINQLIQFYDHFYEKNLKINHENIISLDFWKERLELGFIYDSFNQENRSKEFFEFLDDNDIQDLILMNKIKIFMVVLQNTQYFLTEKGLVTEAKMLQNYFYKKYYTNDDCLVNDFIFFLAEYNFPKENGFRISPDRFKSLFEFLTKIDNKIAVKLYLTYYEVLEEYELIPNLSTLFKISITDYIEIYKTLQFKFNYSTVLNNLWQVFNNQQLDIKEFESLLNLYSDNDFTKYRFCLDLLCENNMLELAMEKCAERISISLGKDYDSNQYGNQLREKTEILFNNIVKYNKDFDFLLTLIKSEDVKEYIEKKFINHKLNEDLPNKKIDHISKAKI